MSALSLPIEVLYSYANADKQLCVELEKHLSLLQHERLITTWHQRQIMAGAGRSESILLTTRADAVGALATPLEVETMSLIEGTHLLLRRAQRFEHASAEEINEAGNIVVALGHFPLALDQAGAYIEETKCSLVDYLERYQSHRQALSKRKRVIR